MGVDYVLFERLAELSTRFRPEGRTLMLGRQRFSVEERFRPLYIEAMARHGLTGEPEDYLQDDGYCETLMRKLGFGEIETLDFSDFEGASVLHDLNAPVPEALHREFDMIFDGGTIEHVFDVPQALRNVFDMLTPGGRFVSANGMNGWPGHGIYQFNPELVWTFWTRGAGCKVHLCQGITKAPRKGEYSVDFPDPADTGKRLRLRGKIPPQRFYLYYEAERLPTSALAAGPVLQSDYETKWAGHETAAETRLDLVEGV